jgi:V8-like Glu-specific endopeptidase
MRELYQRASVIAFLSVLGVFGTSCMADIDEGTTETRTQEQRAVEFIEDDFRYNIREEVSPDWGKNWAGDELGLDPGRRWYRGRINLNSAENVKHVEPSSRESQGTSDSFVIIHEDGQTYEFELPKATQEALTMHYEDLGVTQERLGEGESPVPFEVREAQENLTSKEWAGNVDNRVLRNIASSGQSTSVYARIGRLVSANGELCTATLINGGQSSNVDFIITAAHCLFQKGSSQSATFEPRHDDGDAPHGTWNLSPPYIVYSSWLYNTDCAWVTTLGHTLACAKVDIAVAKVTRPSGVGSLGGLGFQAYGLTSINSANKYHRGYPRCGIAGSPSNCESSLYGDSAMPNLTDEPLSLVDGWYRMLNHGSDTNPGMSGGPMYLNTSGSTMIFGVNFWQFTNCYGSTSGASCPPLTLPNQARRITPDFYSSVVTALSYY